MLQLELLLARERKQWPIGRSLGNLEAIDDSQEVAAKRREVGNLNDVVRHPTCAEVPRQNGLTVVAKSVVFVNFTSEESTVQPNPTFDKEGPALRIAGNAL
ncbi:MAG: hypothetical protein R3F17_04290 [Planctomycetota bacterium]